MRPLALIALFALATPAAAEQATFSVSITGLPTGTLAFRGSESAGQYKVQGEVRSSGLARGLYPAQFTAAAQGRVSGNTYAPAAYSEQVTRRGETKTARYRYMNGVPSITRNPPDDGRKPYHADPAGQNGTVDPLTIAYAILRDRPADLACNLDLQPYDGRERTRIRMSGGSRDGNRLICPGTYTRVAGFDAKDMQKKDWSFTVTYEITGDGTYRVEKVRVPTSLGPVILNRR